MRLIVARLMHDAEVANQRREEKERAQLAATAEASAATAPEAQPRACSAAMRCSIGGWLENSAISRSAHR